MRAAGGDRGHRGEADRRSRSPRLLAVATALLVSLGTIDLHALEEEHTGLAACGAVARTATHPESPRHFDHTDRSTDEPCLACLLLGQNRAALPTASSIAASTVVAGAHGTPSPALHFAGFPTAAAPRGPPATCSHL